MKSFRQTIKRIIVPALIVMLYANCIWATDVGGIINTDTTWSLANSPYRIISDVQLAYGAKLTIEPGVVVNGEDFAIRVFGNLNAVGSNTSNIIFNNVKIKPGNNSPSEPYLINVQFSTINGGEIYYPTGNAIYGSLILRDSRIQDTPYMYLWYPISNCYIERNIFSNTGGISVAVDTRATSISVYIRNNNFYNQTGDAIDIFAIDILVSYGGQATTVEFNSFLSNDRVALKLGPPSGGITDTIAINNYWNTTDTSVIDLMIYDKNDDLGVGGYVIYTPFLTEPHPDTPPLSVGGSVTGISPTEVLCQNVSTRQRVVIRDGASAWDCEAAGLVVTPGDAIRQTITGTAD